MRFDAVTDWYFKPFFLRKKGWKFHQSHLPFCFKFVQLLLFNFDKLKLELKLYDLGDIV